MTPNLSSQSRAGFTLVETLVVVGIVLVLAALLLPVLQSVRATSNQARCTSNLRNIYVAALNFAEDNNGRLPPALGPATSVEPSFTSGQYWWGQAYLGRYAIGPLDRRTSTAGKFTQQEAAIFNCPARFVDGPDTPQSNGNPSISYMMASFYPKDPGQVDPSKYMFRTMQNKSRTMFITEGRGMSLYVANTITQPFGKGQTGLRRYHNKALNVLFLDGHVESFSGSDAELVEMHPNNVK